MTATTTESMGQLPTGYDDKKSRWYIPPELREHYVPISESHRRAEFAAKTPTYDAGNLSARAAEYGEHMIRESGELAKIRKKYRNDPKDGDTAADHLVVAYAKNMTHEDEAWWAHYSIALPAARSRYRSAEAWENGGRQLWEAQHTCEVCGQVNRHTHSTAYGGDDLGVKICPPCRVLVPGVRADLNQVGGRPRRDVVAEWVAKND